MCVCIYVHACIYVYTYMHAHICMHTHIYTHKIPLRIPSFLSQRQGSEDSL